MTNEELEKEVICIMEKEYKSKFLGKVKIIRKPSTITVAIGLHSLEQPLFLGGTLDEEGFLNYIKDTMKHHRLDIAEYFTGYKIDKEICIRTSCNCYD